MTVFLIYFIATGTWAGIYSGATRYDTDEQIYYFVIGFLTGWFTIPIKFVKGFIKVYKESSKKEKLHD